MNFQKKLKAMGFSPADETSTGSIEELDEAVLGLISGGEEDPGEVLHDGGGDAGGGGGGDAGGGGGAGGGTSDPAGGYIRSNTDSNGAINYTVTVVKPAAPVSPSTQPTGLVLR